MNRGEETTKNQRNMDEIINEMEQENFIGRHSEIELFKAFIQPERDDTKVLHIYGTGGIGKSFLLNEFSRISETERLLFLQMNGQDFRNTPSGFLECFFTTMESTLDFVQPQMYQYTLQNCLHTLAKIADTQRIIIAIDSYEHMVNLDRWFRQMFVRHVHPNIFIITAGRHRLKGEWEESPAWRKVIQQIQLKEFNLPQTISFLDQNGMNNDDLIPPIWRFTRGHPLSLTLATLTKEKLDFSSITDQQQVDSSHILIELTKRWLEEVDGEEVHHLIEAAAFFYRFNQVSLSSVLKQEVTNGTFAQLCSLSFIQSSDTGWTMHQLIRDAVKVELKNRNPERYQQLSERMANYFYRKVLSTRSAHDFAQFFYHLGDESIQSTFFPDAMDTSMYLEPVGTYNFHEVVAFFEYKKNNISEAEAEFYSRIINKSYQFYAPYQYNRKELTELMSADYIEKMGYDSARLLKNESGDTVGLSIVVPINKHTLKHLEKEPVSKAYFARLSEKEKKEYAVPEDQVSGWFIRMLEFADSTDVKARSFLLYSLFPKFLSGGKIIVSNPLPFYLKLIKNFGFQKVSNAEHCDYGEDYPSPTYMLDVSGPRLSMYLKQFISNESRNHQMATVTETFSLTDREQEIVKLILENKSNTDIAKELYVAEITIKKHITRILKKVNVKNRTELIKQIMELI